MDRRLTMAQGPYNEIVMDHFQNPRNMGEIEEPSAVAEVGNPVCGDVMKLYLRIEDDRIVDARFKTFGCSAAIASSSMTTELIIGKTIHDALLITNEAVTQALGGLPPAKQHCSVLAEEALQAALDDYKKRREAGK
jgi:nitrogen fixation protein NifU and related proteins